MISFVLPTLGRPGLLAALDSIELWPGDEVLVIGEMHALGPYIRQSDINRGVRFLHCPRGNDWGHSERNFAQAHAKGRYIANLDDDDVFAPGHRLRVSVSSSLFPKYDRNLNTGGNNERDTNFVVAHQRLLHDSEHPSHVILPVLR